MRSVKNICSIHLYCLTLLTSCRRVLVSSSFWFFFSFLVFVLGTNKKTVCTPKYRENLEKNDLDILTPFVIIITGVLILITSLLRAFWHVYCPDPSINAGMTLTTIYPVIIVCNRFRCAHNAIFRVCLMGGYILDKNSTTWPSKSKPIENRLYIA